MVRRKAIIVMVVRFNYGCEIRKWESLDFKMVDDDLVIQILWSRVLVGDV